MGGLRGMMGGMGRPSEEDLVKMEAFMRRLREAPDRLTIVKGPAQANRVAFTEGTGAHWAVAVDARSRHDSPATASSR